MLSKIFEEGRRVKILSEIYPPEDLLPYTLQGITPKKCATFETVYIYVLDTKPILSIREEVK
jgi:hypothetical protein